MSMTHISVFALYAVVLALACSVCVAAEHGQGSAGARNETIKVSNAELAVVLGDKASTAEKRVAELLAKCIKDRTGIKLTQPGGKAAARLVIGTAASNGETKAFPAGRMDIASLGTEGYCIVADSDKSVLYVIGQSDIGVVAGVGRLMREMQYEPGRLTLPARSIAETPRMPNRGIYLWAREEYFGKPEVVDRYIEDLALWGCNGVAFWFEMGQFNSFDDPRAQHWLAMYRRFYGTARRLGMKTGLIMVVNDAYKNSPKDLRITPIIGCPKWYLCPSRPGSVKQMVAWQEQVFKALPGIDIFNLFPADPGGAPARTARPGRRTASGTLPSRLPRGFTRSRRRPKSGWTPGT